MVPAQQLIRFTGFTCMILFAHFFCAAAWLPTEATGIISLQYRHQDEISSTMTSRRILIELGNSELTGSSVEVSKSKKKKNLIMCRTLGRRCLRIRDEIAPTPGDGDPVAPPMVDLPALPTDPEAGHLIVSPPPPAERTNPSSLLSPAGSSGAGVMGQVGKSTGSNVMASTVGIGAGAGVTGMALLILGLLYYFKPDIFLCCKTCVRVQIFHHTSATATSKK